MEERRRGSLRMSRVFEVPAHLRVAARRACEAVVQRARERGRVRVWMPGCKTGGMTYAVAMLLAQAAARCDTPPKILIFGTDDDEYALSVARAGRYPARAALGMDPQLRVRYTFDEGEMIRVSEALRQSCLFSRHELSRDLPMARMALVVCHRVFEGVSGAGRAALIEGFHASLRHGGMLLAFDHVGLFPDELFERVEAGVLRARPARKRPLIGRFGSRPVRASATIAQREPPWSEYPLAGAAPFEPVLQSIALPLLVCDAELRVSFFNVEAQTVFQLSPADAGSTLLALAPRLPGGVELIDVARRTVSAAATRELSARRGGRLYRVRVAALMGWSGSVSITFNDVTELQALQARADRRARQYAALARISKLAVSSPLPSVYEAAIGALLDDRLPRQFNDCWAVTPPSASDIDAERPAWRAGIIVELAGHAGRYEVMAARGFGAEPMSTLRGMGDAAALLDAVVAGACMVSQNGEQAVSAPPSTAPDPSPAGSAHERRALATLGGAMGWPIIGEGGVLGAVALYAWHSEIDDDQRHFVEAIANVLGGALVRHRTRLEVSRPNEASHEQMFAELEALYASLPVGVSIHDRQGLVRHVNRHLARLEAASGSGSDPLERLYAEEVPRWIARVLQSGEPIQDVELFVTAGERRLSWLCNFAPIRDASGTVQGASAVVQDITPFKRVEATLREADQEKDDFLAMLGHELRNPMAAIRNATELLSRIEQPTPQLVRLQSIFDRQTQHTTKLLDGLLDVARVARGKVALELAPVPIVELVRQVVDDRRQQFERRKLELRLPPNELWVIADRARLVQILDNLISNALKFTVASGCIGVEVCSQGERGSIRVNDDGAGIEAELLPRIFEPFRQGQVTMAQSQGLGLGLALVKGLVELHGFQLAAHSAGPGRGASFDIEFPLTRSEERHAPESSISMRRLDLLLVEDNVDIAETLAELLHAVGHQIEVDGNAEDALASLHRRRPDVLLCDIGLPGMDGLELATCLRADPEFCDLKLVAMTGFGDPCTQERIRRAGFDRYLVKPVQLAALCECLASVASGESARLHRRG